MTEIISKVPDGYRELTGTEKEEFLNVGTAITLLQFKSNQHQAELHAAKLEAELAQSRIRDVQREMQIAMQQRDEQNARLKIVGGKEDVIVDGSRVYVIVRPEGWEPPKKSSSEMRLIPGVGRVEITKTPPAVPTPAPEAKKD
jgi:hypothetical protein